VQPLETNIQNSKCINCAYGAVSNSLFPLMLLIIRSPSDSHIKHETSHYQRRYSVTRTHFITLILHVHTILIYTQNYTCHSASTIPRSLMWTLFRSVHRLLVFTDHLQ